MEYQYRYRRHPRGRPQPEWLNRGITVAEGISNSPCTLCGQAILEGNRIVLHEGPWCHLECVSSVGLSKFCKPHRGGT
ncbi:hypothetical protein WJX79_006593 [Trebouxia sp. C0005]